MILDRSVLFLSLVISAHAALSSIHRQGSVRGDEEIDWWKSSVDIKYNPCTMVLGRGFTSTQEQRDKANKFCQTVANRFMEHPVNAGNSRLEDVQCSLRKCKCMADLVRFQRISRWSQEVKEVRDTIELQDYVTDPVFWSWRSKIKDESESTAKHDLRESKDDKDLVALLNTAERTKVEKQWSNIAVYATIGLRKHMEDTFMAYENAAGTKASFFGVFDGHLGHYASAFARDKLMANIVNKVAILRKCEKGLGSCWSSAGGQTDPTTPSECLHRGCYKELAEEVWTGCCCLSSPEDWRKQANTGTHSKWWKLLRAVHTYLKPGGIIDYKTLLTDVFLSADKALIAATQLAESKSGTTALVAIMEESQLIVANVGDSRGVMCDSKGNTVQLSFDHKPGRKDEKERIESAGGYIEYRQHCWRTNGNLAVSRALGDWPEKFEGKHLIGNPEVLIFDLSKYQPQFLVLATDGLYDVMTSDQVVAFLLERLHEEHYGAKSLVRHAYSLGAADNITVMVIYLKEHSWASSPKVERASSRRTPFLSLSRRLTGSLKFPSGRKS